MISIRSVSKSFGPQQVLKDMSLEIAAGETVSIVGPSGVGKSVLLKLIIGILQPDQGKIFIDQKNITAAKTESEKNEIRSVLGVLYQSAALFDSLNVYDNLAFPLRERGKFQGKLQGKQVAEKVDSMLEALSLGDFAYRFPEQISIGIRKRVGLARALITEPKVLLIDEPNTGLDPLVGQEVYDLIKHCKATWGFTGVVISHEIPEVFQVSDKVAMLLGGKIIECGTPEEMLSSKNPAVTQFIEGRIEGPIKIG